jgi:hypothetical protein
VRLSGETDFPCISDERVGATRTYAKLDGDLTFGNYMEALQRGRTYVSDGFSHLIDFKVNDLDLGENDSELALDAAGNLQISARAAAFLSPEQSEVEAALAAKPLTEYPYWHIERGRLGDSRKVAVELIVNGESVASQEITADGNWTDIQFNYPIERSSWVALRIFPSVHTNPIFVEINEQPIAVEKSARWCLRAVEQCWKEKQSRIRKEEQADARKAYDLAEAVYREIMSGSIR